MAPEIMRTLIWVVVGLSVLAAGCAGSGPSRSEFELSVQEMRDRVASATTHVGKAQSRAQLLSRMDDAALVVERAAADLDEAGAAEGFEDEAERLVRELHGLAADLAATAAQLRDPAFEGALPQSGGVQFESWTKANRILRDLRRQGLEVKPWA
jgi:hypothetical protein